MNAGLSEEEKSSRIGYVWNASDWLKIREEYRIVGHLVGSSSIKPRQETYMGLPMTLYPEELTLLKEKNCIRLVYEPYLCETLSANFRNKFDQQETEFNESQRNLYLKKKKYVVKQKIGIILKGKEKGDAKSGSDEVNQNEMMSQEIQKIQSISVLSNVVYIPTSDPWITGSDFEEVEWLYPITDYERLKYHVFKDLWEKNYYITSGEKFGGEFLCYLGDPSKFHASFIIICKRYNEKFSVKDLVIFGRVGTHTKKSVILATEYEDRITYHSLQWVQNTKIDSKTIK